MGLLSTFSAASGRAFGFTRSAIAAATDAFFNRVTLLLPGNGTNGAQNNTFLDSSTNNFTITRNGNTTQGAFSPFSQTGWSNFFDGASDYLAVTNDTLLNPGTGDFTFECWVYATAAVTNLSIFEGATSGLTIAFDANSYLGVAQSNVAFLINDTVAFPQNQWVHIAVARSGTVLSLFKNGSRVATTSSNSTNFVTATENRIGRSAGTAYFTGYIAELRFIKGAAIYSPSSTSITVPTAPLTTTSQGATATQVELLTCQSNRFVDNSSNGFAITISGTGNAPSVQAFSPFAPSAAYSAATNGGSGYFDGTGDYLTLPNDANLDLASGDFTVEAWFYATASSGDRPIVQRFNGNLTIDRSQQQYEIRYNNGTLLIAPMIGTTNYEMSFASVPINQWNHCALVRTGNNFYAYLNGVRNATTRTISGSMNTGTWLTYIGYWAVSGSGSFFNGFISDVRINKGQALYTGATYTVPTAPLTTTSQSSTATNVELLTNFTNAGITDATAKNDLETVGNAQISTTQSKFGGSSMYFDGTTNTYLTPNPATTDLFAFGSGDWTIEFWIYSATAQSAMLIDWRPASTSGAYITFYLSSGVPTLFVSSADRITGGAAISTNTWVHLAIARSGTSTKLFVNGTQSGSTYTDSTVYLGAALRPRIGANGNTLPGSPGYFTGYIDDLRITKGYARYTASFTPPTAAFATQ